ncbi:MAG: hypothetical protein P1Q69_03440 [Candidatus Thorarchaeota archaeon]|nr:hypothetical protein [Candidatus Thorarchaeota archaeon]
MSLQEKFEEEMLDICEKYYRLDKERDDIEDQLEHLHEYMEITLRKYDKEEFDDPRAPVKVRRLVYTNERMKKGGKDMLREILTPEQWNDIYEEAEEVERIRVTSRKEKKKKKKKS